MHTLIYNFYQICILKLGPQDIPRSNILLLLMSLLVILMVTMIDSLVETGRDDIILLEAGLLAALYIFVYVALRFSNKTARFLQSTTAILGCEIFIYCCIYAILFFAKYIGQSANIIVFVLVIYLWRLCIVSHIFRNMLDSSYFTAISLTIIYEIYRFNIILVVNNMGG